MFHHSCILYIIINPMKKNLFTIIIALVCSIFACEAQNLMLDTEVPDTSIAVIGYFCKNDSMTFRKTYSKIKVEKGDTTINDMYTEDFLIVVTDSTSKGYRMKFIPVAFDYSEESDSIHRIMQAKLSELSKDIVCEFTTDEMGRVQNIENWREIRDKMKVGIKGMCDTLYSTIPFLNDIMPRKQVENTLLLMFSTEQGVREAYNELDELFGLHGNLFDIGDSEFDTQDNGYPMHVTASIGYTPVEDENNDFDDDYSIISKSVTTVPIEDILDLGLGNMGLMMTDALSDSLANHRKDMIDSITAAMPNGAKNINIINNEYYGYFFNGWPKECFNQKVAGYGLGERIETTHIEWIMRNWDFVKPIDEDKSSHNI